MCLHRVYLLLSFCFSLVGFYYHPLQLSVSGEFSLSESGVSAGAQTENSTVLKQCKGCVGGWVASGNGETTQYDPGSPL